VVWGEVEEGNGKFVEWLRCEGKRRRGSEREDTSAAPFKAFPVLV